MPDRQRRRLPSRNFAAASFATVAFAALVFLAPAAAGAEPEDPGVVGFDAFGPAEGLAGGTVFSVVQDRRGFVWLGTDAGLDRWDGNVFAHFDAAFGVAGKLPHPTVLKVFEDSAGRIWAGTPAGLSLLDPATRTFANFVPDFLERRDFPQGFWAIAQDSRGRLAIGTLGGGLLWFDPEAKAFVGRLEDSRIATVFSVYAEADGSLLVGTNGPTFRVGADGAVAEVRDAAGEPLRNAMAIHVGADGAAWIGSMFGLYRRPPGGAAFARFSADDGSLPAVFIRALASDEEGRLWIGTTSGVYVLQGGLARLFKHDAADPRSLPGDTVNALAPLADGSLLAGIYRGGLARWSADAYPVLAYRARPDGTGLPGNYVTAVAFGPRGNLWIAVDGRGLSRLEGGRIRSLDLPELAGKQIFGLAALPNARAVAASSDGVYLVEAASPSASRLAFRGFSPPRTVYSYQIAADQRGTLWLASSVGGFTRIDPPYDSLVWVAMDATAVRPRALYCVAVDAEGRIWGGGKDSTLYMHDPRNGAWKEYPDEDALAAGLLNHEIVALLAQPDGKIWVGGLTGIREFDPETSARRDLPANVLPPAGLLRAMSGDAAGTWLGTTRGAVFLDRAGGPPRLFAEKNGLPSDLVSLYAAATDGRGTFAFGTDAGVAVLKSSLPAARAPGTPVVDFVSAAEETTYPVSDGGRLPNIVLTAEGARRVEIGLAPLDFGLVDPSDYQYQVRGLDREWRRAEGFRLSLGSLPAGDYRLAVRVRTSGDAWSKPADILAATVRPPFWATWPFALACLAAAAALVVAIVRLRTASIVRYNRVLKERAETQAVALAEASKLADLGRLITGVAHELNTPIGNAITAASFLEESLGSGADPSLLEGLALVGRNLKSSAELIAALRVFSGQYPAGAVQALTARDAEALARAASEPFAEIVEVRMEFDGKVSADPAVLGRILGELVKNAAEHAYPDGKGRILVSAELAKGAARFVVKDEGRGMTDDEKAHAFEPFYKGKRGTKGHGLGLAVAYALTASCLKGSLRIEDPPAGGVAVVLEFPQGDR